MRLARGPDIRHTEAMLHLMKLCVGTREVAELREWQAERLAEKGELYHLTRNCPRRAKEILDGGSLYWVIGGAMVVRQAITDIRQAKFQDGSACAALMLDPRLVAVLGRPTRPFQGWRYLAAESAPPDLRKSGKARGVAGLPESLRRELGELGLL